jgi:cyclic peptide transporter
VNSLAKPRSLLFYALIIILGVINGLLNTCLLVFLNSLIQKKNIPFFHGYNWEAFTALLILTFITNKYFQNYVIRFTNKLLTEFELNILNKLRLTKLCDFERIGSERVYTAIEDAREFSHMPAVFTNTFNAAITIVICLFYLFFISVPGSLLLLIIIFVLIVFYIRKYGALKKPRKKLRLLNERYYKILDDLLKGFKELKMNGIMNERLYDEFLKKNRTEAMTLEIESSMGFLNNVLIGRYGWYVVIGFISFVLPVLARMDNSSVISFILVILFLIGPINMIMSLMPFFTNIAVANERLKAFGQTISGNKEETVDNGQRELCSPVFHKIKFEDVVFEYFTEGSDKPFVLGPINLTVNQGEIIFITGGNGSGKSTFLYLLAGLYMPLSGSIYLNGKKIGEDDYPVYRSLMSVIFSDCHVFSENYGNTAWENSDKMNGLLSLMHLESIIEKSEGRAVRKKLSKGQEKRAAMILAILDERPFFALDEWAAEQDPHFRRYFYEQLLDELRQRGKTVVAITHDDAYFKHADRVIKFNYGKIGMPVLDSSTP